jgi:hypothetical protein
VVEAGLMDAGSNGIVDVGRFHGALTFEMELWELKERRATDREARWNEGIMESRNDDGGQL